ncbi:hypothetical protein [Kamptonema formosum]|uniref:hypothetical protein n=1 Tax=Kamptonema formosum TaxID=331992 RepID=UPI0003489336|nr:hypothetical protein [Oscillatoria sp. PCC 10802]
MSTISKYFLKNSESGLLAFREVLDSGAGSRVPPFRLNMRWIAFAGHAGGGKSSAAVASSVPTGDWGAWRWPGQGSRTNAHSSELRAPAGWL